MPDSIKNMPDVSFIDGKNVTDIRGEMVEDYEAYVSKATGSKVKLSRVSRDRMILYACANAIHQGFQYTDRAGKMNFLKWSYSDFLDHLGKFRRVTRNPAAIYGIDHPCIGNAYSARHSRCRTKLRLLFHRRICRDTSKSFLRRRSSDLRRGWQRRKQLRCRRGFRNRRPTPLH